MFLLPERLFGQGSHKLSGSTFMLNPFWLSVSSGRLGLLDYDEVELSNLHRQVLHGEKNQGQAKALSAASAVSRYWLTLCGYCMNHLILFDMYSRCSVTVLISVFYIVYFVTAGHWMMYAGALLSHRRLYLVLYFSSVCKCCVNVLF